MTKVDITKLWPIAGKADEIADHLATTQADYRIALQLIIQRVESRLARKKLDAMRVNLAWVIVVGSWGELHNPEPTPEQLVE